MSADEKLKLIKQTFKEKGGSAMKNARSKMKARFKDDSNISKAITYFANTTLRKPLPVFPALIALSCEAVGGDSKKTIPFGEAIVYISAAADLHDDVIDNSPEKNGIATVFGKFGATTTILAGDVLLSEGFTSLTHSRIPLAQSKFEEVFRIINDSILEICKAEALEAQFHRSACVSPEVMHQIIQLKAVVPEIAMKIGAIIGGGDVKNVEELGKFGRAYGVATIIAEEFADLLDIKEFTSRIKNECPPLPLIYALQNSEMKKIFEAKMGSKDFSKSDFDQLLELILNSNEVTNLQKIFIQDIKAAIKKLPLCVNGKIRKELENILLVPLVYFE